MLVDSIATWLVIRKPFFSKILKKNVVITLNKRKKKKREKRKKRKNKQRNKKYRKMAFV